jgi:translocation and assembly module TamB
MQPVEGKLLGKVVVNPTGGIPRVSFELSGTNVTTLSVTTSNLALNGELDWPLLKVNSAQVEMDDASKILLAGTFDLKQKIVSDGQLHSSGPFGGQFLPADFAFATASLTAQFGGPLNALTNSAQFEVKHFEMPHLNPMDIDGQWNAEGLNFKDAQVKLAAGGSSVLLKGSVDLEQKQKDLTLTALELDESNQTVLRLQQPAQIVFEPQNTNGTWNLSVESLSMSGEGRDFRLAAQVTWPERGTFESDAHGLDARLLKDFIPQADAEARVNRFSLSGGWTNGPIAFQLAADASLKTMEKLPFSAHAKLTGGAQGIAIDQLSVSSATQAVCSAEGSLPIFCDPTRQDSMIQIDSDAPLKLRVSTDPDSILWQKIGAATGLKLQEPNLAADLDGTWAAPRGQVTLQAQRIELAEREHPLPAVENLDFLAVMDRATAQVSKCNFQIEKQPVSFTGEIPLGESFWSGLRHQQRHLPDWRDATGHLKMQNAQFAAFTSFLPQILSPEGAANVDISLEHGGNFRGEFSVTNARTRPLESLGPVRNIQALAHLDGQTVRLEEASAEIGGQRVLVDGSVELNEQILRTNGVPPFGLHLTGTNVPLARNPSVLLRADLNLAATNSGSEVPVISGTVKLRNSLFLADLQSLVPEGTASPRQRPPYFSLEIEPWANWNLKVNVQGTGFLRVQTPLFQGKVSTVLNLVGTLESPLVLGQVQIDSGSSIVFPFSSLDVKQGFISLTSENPYRPTLYVDAEARRFGYEVKMEATGPVESPVVQFSSIPSLSSEEIVLMLSAGQIPVGLGVTTTMQQRAEGLGVFVGKNLLSDLGFGGNGQDRLTIRSGEYISESGKPTYDVEYKLTDRWSVIGSYDRFDQYDLDLKWKIYSK